MGWFKGGVIGVILILLIETGLFFTGHVCQLFAGGNSKICSLIIIPFTLIANVLNYSVKINYLISLGIFIVIFFAIGAVLFRKN